MNDVFLTIFPIHRLKNQQFKKTAAFEQEGIFYWATSVVKHHSLLNRFTWAALKIVAASLEAKS